MWKGQLNVVMTLATETTSRSVVLLVTIDIQTREPIDDSHVL